MPYPINYKEFDSTLEFHDEVVELYDEAKRYLIGFKWCQFIKDCFLYTNLGKVFSIFLFEIDNNQSRDDDFIWVVVGDIPPMYLDIHGPKTTKEVIKVYIGLAEDWIENINNGKSVDDCFPFNVVPTFEMANLLQSKISFMGSSLLENIEDIAIA